MKDTPDPGRRDFVLGRLPEASPAQGGESHVSSLVVHVRPELMDAVTRAVAALPGAEVHARDPAGKFVMTLETRSEFEIVRLLDAIQQMPGVLSAALVFHHCESDSA